MTQGTDEGKPEIETVWARIADHAGQTFSTITGLEFTYEVPGNYLLVSRTIRNLSHSNFAKALAQMPTDSPADLRDRQGASYTWAILMDDRIRAGEW